jgi:hypothetical protein
LSYTEVILPVADDIEIPASGLVTAATAAKIVGVKPITIRVWKNRQHLDVARDTDGTPLLDNRGRQLFELLDVINTEFRLREHARRPVPPYARRNPR